MTPTLRRLAGTRPGLTTFRDAVVVVTGAGSGMGRSYALALAARGAVLALNDYDAAALDETVAALPTGTRVLARAYDVADRAATYAFADDVRAELGPAHAVINNAGIEGGVQPVWALDDADYDRVMAVNFHGVLHGTRAFLPHLLERGSGAVVNVSSIFGLVGTPSHSDYCASKFAVRGFTEALAAETAASGIAVHLVHPGGIATSIARGEGSQQFAQKYLRTSPDDIAEVVLDGILSGRSRIVYGESAARTWLGARALPMGLMARLTRRDINPTLDQTAYAALQERSRA